MATPTIQARAAASEAGTILRQWRGSRGKTQLDLSFDSGISQKHISFVESGRSTPSRQTLLDLAQALEIPLREQNTLLLAAGYAPVQGGCHALLCVPVCGPSESRGPSREVATMTQLVIPTVWYVEGNLLVDVSTLSGLVRQVAEEVNGWDGEGADPQTVRAFDHMLQTLADRIDVDCIALVTAASQGSGRQPAGGS